MGDPRDPDRGLGGIVRVADFEPLARAAMDEATFDYIARGSWDEVSLAENERAWRRRRFRPRVLVDVSQVEPSTTLLGSPSAFPLAIAPMAIHGVCHPDGEIASARAAATAGVPFALSTMSSRSIEEVAEGAPDGTRWFQLYVQRDRGLTRSFVDRAVSTGYQAIMLTVDLPVLGYRERDLRSGFALPALGNFQATPPTHRTDFPGFPEQLDAVALSRGLVWDDLASIQNWSPLPIVLKGIMTAEDARLAIDHEVDAIVVSNHGGRQLDRVPAAVDVLAEVVEAVEGRAEVWVDGGVRRGLDIAAAIALGARGVLVGRPILWALATGGQAGVERALAILREEFEITLRLLGASSPSDIRSEHIG